MTLPFTTYRLNLPGRQVTIDHPWVMGIINVTPDSFYGGSRVDDEQALVGRVQEMLEAGAEVLDLGACSTRPGSLSVDARTEMERLKWALKIIRREAPWAIVSVDTFRADVARRCVEECFADIVNDVSGGTLDSDMFSTMARLRVPYILTHMRGTPAIMSRMNSYRDVADDVCKWLAQRIAMLRDMGLTDVIADPGFGFAKDTGQNYELLAALGDFHSLGVPLLAGLSRKRMIYDLLGITPAEALNGTTVANTIALLQGVHILRVHDVQAAIQAVRITAMLRHGQNKHELTNE